MESRAKSKTANTPSSATPAPEAEPARKRRRANDPPPSSAAAEEIEVVTFECLMNARYHSAREAFLDFVHRVFMFGVIVTGASAVLALIPDKSIPTSILAASAAIIGALDLTFDLSNRARAHTLMKRRYFELLADLSSDTKTSTEAIACLHRYSADEEPPFHALMCASWNAAQEMLYGDDASKYLIPRRIRVLQNIWRFEGRKFDFEKAAST